eukprot:TRINITY_DN422_c1_g2_i2.p1 TRINITY_DN422_c1_g2~~TRINITY_DN422_c1_g2_i2.p1  ORF type:complete len:444 (+),score=120.73 TRINITY_DN422_c1_g2_i2:77-1408(+)
MALSKALPLAMLASASQAEESGQFVPLCIAEQCLPEMKALATDAYVHDVANCTVANFGPCASKAWQCLGDDSCRKVVDCAPAVFDKCKGDIWKMLTDPSEREKLECIAQCVGKDGKIDPLCVAGKCTKAAASCLLDATCRDAATCAPDALLHCSVPAAECVFGKSGVCRDNLKCLGHGLYQCGASTVNLFTDSKIADIVTCAGSKCPHPATPQQQLSFDAVAPLDEPKNSAAQLLCVAEKCGSKVLKIVEGQDTKDLLSCATKGELGITCPSVWKCFGEPSCNEALSCWAKPFETCKGDLWKILTDATERKRINDSAGCLKKCAAEHKDDMVEGLFCVMDTCSSAILDCFHDDTCRGAAKCLPDTLGQCVMPHLDAYLHQEMFRNATKCIGVGLEYCGRGAVEMLRDQDIAEAIQCASQCTRTPGSFGALNIDTASPATMFVV